MAKRIGVHLGTAGGASNAVDRAHEIGANTLQIFSSSPRMWRPQKIDPKQAERMRTQRAKFDVGPLVIHTSYLVNVCCQTEDFREKSVVAFRGEIERALMLGAEYLVMHPGSWMGLTRNVGFNRAAESIQKGGGGRAGGGAGGGGRGGGAAGAGGGGAGGGPARAEAGRPRGGGGRGRPPE